MATARSIAVIGRGVIGLSIAHRLIKAGFAVTVLGPRECAGMASYAAMGLSSVKGLSQARAPLFAAKLAGHCGLKDWTAELSRDAGLAIDTDFSGVAELYAGAEERLELCRRVYQQQSYEDFSTKDWTLKELQARMPAASAFNSLYTGALFYPQDGWICPSDVMLALSAFVEKHGAHVYQRVLELQPQENGWEIALEGDSRLCFAEVVLAAGVFGDEILANSQIDFAAQTKVGGASVIRRPSEPENGCGLFLRANMSLVFRSERVYCGSTSVLLNDPSSAMEQLVLSPHNRDLLVAKIRRNFGNGAPQPFPQSQWQWGVRGRYHHRQPLVGPLWRSGMGRPLWLATGFYKNGFQLARQTAETICSYLQNHTVSPPFSTFHPQLFS